MKSKSKKEKLLEQLETKKQNKIVTKDVKDNSTKKP